MKLKHATKKQILLLLMVGALTGIFGIVNIANAWDGQPAQGVGQDAATPTPSAPQKACADCHPNVQNAWLESPHAQAASNPVFLEGWENMERPAECFLCHQADFNAETGEYVSKGTVCETCHGTIGPDHPPAEVAQRSDEEYCGTCHPTTLGEVRVSGHSTANEVRCVDCHDPHSQKVLFENPDDMCKDCHTEDLTKMEESLSKLHLQENIPCASCHTLDVPHTFLYNFQHEDTTAFFQGFDCTSEISDSVANRMGTNHETLGSYVSDQMTWPVVHRVSRLESAPQCSDCHVMDDKLRSDFMALGYTSEDVDNLAWETDDFPPLTETELTKLVATPKRGWSWVYWALGVVAVFGLFEFTFAQKLSGHSLPRQGGFLSALRKRFAKKEKKAADEKQDKEQ